MPEKKNIKKQLMAFKTFNGLIPVFQLLKKENQIFPESLQAQHKHFGKTHMFRKYLDDL